MKKIIVILCLFIDCKSFSQDINLNVEELNIADTVFNQHPQHLLIRMIEMNASLDTVILYTETEYAPKPVDSTFYITNENFSRSTIKMPFETFKAAFPNGELNEEIANQILASFKIKIKD